MTIYDVFSLLGGVGLFLFGMTIMSSGLRNACGDNLQNILEKATRNSFTAVGVGTGMTLLIQSSSATDVMVIGFVNAGMMTLTQAIGVIMGANIGTTITAQITAFNLAAYAPLILFVGAIMYLFVKKRIIKHFGEIIMGFGMLFVGISMLKSAIAPLSQTQTFVEFLSCLDNPFIAILFGVGFTALLQSSSSSTVIFQAFAIQGLLSYHTAVYLVIGAAIGSVTPNLLASLTTNRNGKRTAVLNLIFNLIRAGILVLLINVFPIILKLIQGTSPDIGRQIANTHTIFAIIAVLILLPFTKFIVRLSEKIIPIKPEESEDLEERKLKFMTKVDVPGEMAVDLAHREIARMGRIAQKNLIKAIDCFFDYSEEKASSVRSREDNVNTLSRLIGDALSRLATYDLNSAARHRVSDMTMALTDMERISDHAENIVEYIEEMRRGKSTMSDIATEELERMTGEALKSLELCMGIFESEDFTKLPMVEAFEVEIDSMEDILIHNHVDRIMQASCNPTAGVIYTDMVTALERIGDHAYNLAHALEPTRKRVNNL